ncbi:MAG: helix-turn-helix transcriptional regulator [Clostridia bacterium]|nr:helix-turn-helix transcriptional regulator [Clostridia bacterium]
MNLGEKIYTYRTRKDLSQGELAERLDVSRQSVSKWETDASVPELDKLVRLCEVFGITLDELVNGEPTQSEEPPRQSEQAEEPPVEPTYVQPTSVQTAPRRRETDDRWRKTAGLILVCTAAVIFILLTAFGEVVGGLIFASPFALCGLICMLFKKHIGLWCSWAIYFCVATYLAWATGTTTTSFIFHMIYYSLLGGMTVGTIISMALFAVHVALIVVTVVMFRARLIPLTRPKIVCSILGGAALLLMWFVLPAVSVSFEQTSNSRLEIRMLSWVGYFADWAETAISVWLLTTYVPHLRAWLKDRKIRRSE